MASDDPDMNVALTVSGESTIAKAIERAQKHMEHILNTSLHIAVTGETGTGKSSFINAIRGLKSDDEGAAETGVTETTKEPTPYKYPIIPNVTLWDLPGIGTLKFKAKTYVKNMQFDRYDFFIIISSERFKENDIMLAKEIKKRKKFFYFIRSKIDNDIRAEETKKGFNKEETLSKIKANCLENLKEIENPKVFLISSKNIKDFDFEKLIKTLNSDLPQLYALLQSVPVSSVSMLKKKVKMFEKAAWAAAVCSGGIAVIPVPGLSLACDADILVAFFTRCYYSFGLDDKSLQKLSERMNKPHLQSLIKSPLVLALAESSTTRVALSALAGGAVAESLLSLVPGVGSAIAGVMSFTLTLKLLKKGLKELEDAALMVLREAGIQ